MDEFYGSAEAYRAYHEARGREVASSDDEINVALLIASEWLDGVFTWPGRKVSTVRGVQVRDWPRYDVWDRALHAVDYKTVPIEIERATYEVAMRWIADNSVLLADYTPDKYKRVSIEGALAVEYRGLTAQTAQTQFPVLSAILAPLTGGSGVSSLSSSAVRV